MANVTWDPSNKSTFCTLSGGNLTATSSAGTVGVFATGAQATGKFYFELTQGATAFTTDSLGIALPSASLAGSTGAGMMQLFFSSATACAVSVNGTTVISAATYGSVTTGSGTVFCLAVDFDNQSIWFRVGASANWNGSATANPATNTGGASFSAMSRAFFFPHLSLANSSHAVTANFGDSAFSGTVPSGFTSGWPDNAYAVATQLAVEEWADGNPVAQITQLAVEEWAASIAASGNAIVTQLAVEQWAKVDAATTGRKRRRVSIAT